MGVYGYILIGIAVRTSDADDLSLLSPWLMNFDPMTLDLVKQSSKVGLHVNIKKTKVLSLTDHHTPPICINEQNIGGIEQFLDLGSAVSNDGDTELDIASRINSAVLPKIES